MRMFSPMIFDILLKLTTCYKITLSPSIFLSLSIASFVKGLFLRSTFLRRFKNSMADGWIVLNMLLERSISSNLSSPSSS